MQPPFFVFKKNSGELKRVGSQNKAGRYVGNGPLLCSVVCFGYRAMMNRRLASALVPFTRSV